MAIDVFAEGFANHFFFPKAIAKQRQPIARRSEEIIPSPVFTIWFIVPAKKQTEAIANIIQRSLFLLIFINYASINSGGSNLRPILKRILFF